MQKTQQILSVRTRRINELALLLQCSVAKATRIYYIMLGA